MNKIKKIFLAGGCFWGVEAFFKRIYGVEKTEVGYANATIEKPRYEDVDSGYSETVLIEYDSEKTNYRLLIKYLFKIIDPTSLNKQGGDEGIQYRTGVYYTNEEEKEIALSVIGEESKNYDKPIVVEVLPLKSFYPAEDYHQDYLDKNPTGYCHVSLSKANEIIVDDSKYKKKSDEQLKEELTQLQYDVTQNNHTEKPFDNEFNDKTDIGIYVDITSGEPLFLSKDKFNSGCGWPSFAKPISKEVINYFEDTSLSRVRTEVRSRLGDSHLGHVFNDGPSELGGLRYCINSASLRFIPLAEMEKEGYGEFVELLKNF